MEHMGRGGGEGGVPNTYTRDKLVTETSGEKLKYIKSFWCTDNTSKPTNLAENAKLETRVEGIQTESYLSGKGVLEF